MQKLHLRRSGAFALLLAGLLSGCASVREPCHLPTICPACPDCVSTQKGATAVTPSAPPLQAATWGELPGWRDDTDLRAFWNAYLASCKALLARPQAAAWQRVCELSRSVDGGDAAAVHAYFEQHFAPYALVEPDGNREGLITGYYEPLIRGSRLRRSAGQVPVLAVPSDLLTIDLSEVAPELRNLRLRGRLQGNRVVPYYSRAEIDGQTKSPAQILLWADDPVEFFFLQIQGSGRVSLPDGKTVRIAYADQNGHPYRSIGKVLIDRGALLPGQASMQGIQAWARAHPEQLSGLLDANPSYVFFREMPDDGLGPLGALGVPLTAGRSIAVDPRQLPLGAPVFLATTEPNATRPLDRLVVAQDTGGAIRGVVRADFFWGYGAEAGQQAGRMKQSGRMWVLLPPEAAPRD